MTYRSDGGVRIIHRHANIAGSSNGRTADFGSANAGSSPAPASNPEPVGHDWLEEFREKFPEEFTEDEAARHHVEQCGSRSASDRRFAA